MNQLWLVALACCWVAPRASAISLSLPPVADTSLIEIAPTNNNGGQAWLLAGKIQNDVFRVRALMRFDLSAIPTNATVRSAAVTLEVTREPSDGLANAPFGLCRMLRSWGEGGKVATTSPGQGSPATFGEATWLHSHFPTNAWTTPGAAQGVDYSDVESSFQFIYGVNQSPYRFESTPELVADVQDWIRDPAGNFGWMLRCDDEATPFTARRFGSREDANASPKLEVDYLVPPEVISARHTGNEFQLAFTAWPGQSHAVEFRDSVALGTWQTLTNIGIVAASTQIIITDVPALPQRWYRVVGF